MNWAIDTKNGCIRNLRMKYSFVFYMASFHREVNFHPVPCLSKKQIQVKTLCEKHLCNLQFKKYCSKRGKVSM